MNPNNLIIFSDILFLLQENFNEYISYKIFKIDSKHLFPKWKESNGNILNFMTRLDDNNKEKLITWVLNYKNM